MELHTMLDELPSGDRDGMVPVALPTTIGEGIVPNAVAVDIEAVMTAMDVDPVLGIVDNAGTCVGVMEGGGKVGIAGGCGTGTVELGSVDRDDVAGCADSVRNGAVALLVADVEEVADIVDGSVPIASAIADTGVTVTVGVPGVICPVGVEHVTTVPGVEGSEASGNGASVVSGAPDWVAAENGLGPLSGDDTIAPGVEGIPMAVVPMVETCARLALQPSSRAAAANSWCLMWDSFQPRAR